MALDAFSNGPSNYLKRLLVFLPAKSKALVAF